MLLYSDIITGEELFTDAYPMKLVDDFVYEVDCALIIVKEGAVDIGANPSAEEQEEALEEGATQVNNVVYSMRLQETSFDKKTYLAHLKGYLKGVKGKILQGDNSDREELAKAFEKKAQEFAKKVIAGIPKGKYQFYTSATPMTEDGDEGMVALLDFRDDGITPYFTFWKDGLKEMKL